MTNILQKYAPMFANKPDAKLMVFLAQQLKGFEVELAYTELRANLTDDVEEVVHCDLRADELRTLIVEHQSLYNTVRNLVPMDVREYAMWHYNNGFALPQILADPVNRGIEEDHDMTEALKESMTRAEVAGEPAPDLTIDPSSEFAKAAGIADAPATAPTTEPPTTEAPVETDVQRRQREAAEKLARMRAERAATVS